MIDSYTVLNQYCVMKKRDLFPMNQMGLRLNKIVNFFMSVEKFRTLKPLGTLCQGVRILRRKKMEILYHLL